jgi:hypothetical protein
LGEVIAALDPALFKACFSAPPAPWVPVPAGMDRPQGRWIEGLREVEPDLVAIDGKTSRRTHARSQGREP